jgi:hypothetical protein
MKESPQMKQLEEILRSSKMVAGGFMGSDNRSLPEIIEADMAEVAKSGFSLAQITTRMKEITSAAILGLGNWVLIPFRGMQPITTDVVTITEHTTTEEEQAATHELKTRVEEAKGSLVCPWPHPGRFAKRVTEVQLIKTGETIMWSDLNIHMIAEHGFFEGKGSSFRIEPDELIKIIF